VNERVFVADCIHTQTSVSLLWAEISWWELWEPDSTNLQHRQSIYMYAPCLEEDLQNTWQNKHTILLPRKSGAST